MEERISDNLPRSQRGTCRDIEGLDLRLADAFAALSLLGDDENPMSPDQAIARARREAESFRLWEESGSPIGGVALRLGDGEQVALITGGRQAMAAVCSIKEYRPGTVLHAFKTEDEHFGEVKLYSVRLSDIPPAGFPYTRQYRNGQTLMLNFEHGPGGQLDVSVDYTLAQNEDSAHASARRYGLVTVAALAALVVYRLMFSLWRKVGGVPGVVWEPHLAVVSYVMVAGLSTTLLTSSWGVFPSRHETRETPTGVSAAGITYTPEAAGFHHGKVDKNAGESYSPTPTTNTAIVLLPRDQGRVLLHFNDGTILYTLSDSTAGNAPELSYIVSALGSLSDDSYPSEFPDAALALRVGPTFMASGPTFAGISEEQLGQVVLAHFKDGESASDYSAFGGQRSAVPEPMTMILIGTGLAGIAARIRRRRGQKA